jgi:hypothetical protein
MYRPRWSLYFSISSISVSLTAISLPENVSESKGYRRPNGQVGKGGFDAQGKCRACPFVRSRTRYERVSGVWYYYFLTNDNHSLHDRRIQEYEVDLQRKKDRWLLRKGVEAADDEQEILRNLRQITDTFDEFQTKVLLKVERNTDTLIQVRVLLSGVQCLCSLHTIGPRFPEHATLSRGSLLYGCWLRPARMH